MRDELTDHEWAAIGPMLEAGRPSTGERPSRSQWHLLAVAIWSTLARSARQSRSLTTCYNRSFDGGGLAFEAGSFIGPKMPNRLRWGHRVKRTLPGS